MSWRNLLPGLIALTVVVAVALGVLLFSGIGRVRGETMRLYVVTSGARGVMQGTDVWLEGQKVGVVDGVEFRAPGADTTARVVIVMTVRAKDAGQIRRDSRAQVRSGANVISPMVVYLSSGSPSSPAARSGDTLYARAQSDMEIAGVKVQAATEQLGPLMADARTVMAHVRNPRGTVGAALTDRGGPDVARLRVQVARLRERMLGGGKASGGMMAHAQSALARTDSIRALLKSPNSAFGRFRRDSTLVRTVADLRDELAHLRSRLDEADGTLPRLASDSAITRAVTDAQREMALLFDDIRRRPSRYIVF